MIYRIKLLLFGFLVVGVLSCQQGKENRQQIYFNDFEQGDLLQITGGKLISFNKSQVLGNYHNGGFKLQLDQLPAHDLVEISFDLYIHDSWDGNKTAEGIDGPDIWGLYLDGAPYVYTTFANADCPSGFCPPQAYPDNYPNNNHNPKSNAFATNLPSVCSSGGTTGYKIKKTLAHRNGQFNLQCLDQLVQTNTSDPLCDESWSVDNLKITLIQLN